VVIRIRELVVYCTESNLKICKRPDNSVVHIGIEALIKLCNIPIAVSNLQTDITAVIVRELHGNDRTVAPVCFPPEVITVEIPPVFQPVTLLC